MTTVGDQVNGALRVLGVLAEGETPSAETSQDALEALNQMLDSWSTERLAVYSTMDQVFTWPAGQISRTIGPSGDFVGLRPIALDDSTYFKDPGTGVSYGLKIINQQQYNGIALKTATSTFPQVIWVNMDMPDATLTVYPVPTRSLEFHIVSVYPLTQATSLSTDLVFPPGYLRAFKFNLAVEIAEEFGLTPPPSVVKKATSSKRNLKRINSPDDVMSMPYGLVARAQRYNIFAGNY